MAAKSNHATASEPTARRQHPDLPRIDRFDPEFVAHADEVYTGLRDEGRVVRVWVGVGDADGESDEAARRRSPFVSHESWCVTRYDDIVTGLLDERFSAQIRPGDTPPPDADHGPQEEAPKSFRAFAKSIITLDPPDHDRIRKLVQPSFTGHGMDAMRPAIQRIADDLLDRAEAAAAERGEVAPNRRLDLVEQFAYPLPVTVISDLLGIPDGDRAQAKAWTENLLRVDRQRDPEVGAAVQQGLADFTDYLSDLFARKRAAPTDDMISRMVLIEDGGDTLSEEEALGTVFLMYLAGHVTTVNLVANGVVALLTHPDELAKLRQNPALVKNAVEETLRYWGPVDFLGRRTVTEDFVLAGTPVAAGDQVGFAIAGANRDPARFADPDRYDISRADANRHIAFGKGVHACLGAPLARAEGQIAFETLTRRYPDLRLAVPFEELQWGTGLRGFREVPLFF